MYDPSIFLHNYWLITLVLVWTLIWKGMALWKAARLNQRNWFVVMLILNTMGIMEIVYLFIITRDQKIS